MEEQKKLPRREANKIIVRYSVIGGILFIAYFLLMQLMGLAHVTILRFANYLIFVLIGIFELQKIREKCNNQIYYLQGFGINIITGIFSFMIFGVFVFIYSYFDPFFIDTVSRMYPASASFAHYNAVFLVVSEGIAYSAILSLCLMQYYKRFSIPHKEISKPGWLNKQHHPVSH